MPLGARANSSAGFTLIELLVGVAIIGLIVAMAAVSFSSYSGAKTLDADTARVVSLLADARARTLASIGDTHYGVHFESSKAVLFEGSTYSESETENIELLLGARVTLSADLEGGGSEVVFSRLTGKASKSGTITLTLESSTSTKDIIISESGVAYVE